MGRGRERSKRMTGETTEATRPIVNIEGEKVALGPLCRDLLPLMRTWLNDLMIHRTLPPAPPPPLTIGSLDGWYDRVTSGERDVAFMIYERATGIPIGTTDWHAIDYRNWT